MKKKSVVLALAFCLLLALAAMAAEPGSADDPLVSKSYLDTVVVPYLEGLISSGGTAAVFGVVEVPAGKNLIGGAGCEMILRMGSAVIVATAKGGVCDSTSGIDLPNAAEAPLNHLLIVPLNDGRGLLAAEKCLVMVKGAYEIK